jgi:uncharacterized membrane protein YcjF (UPF0283 family)
MGTSISYRAPQVPRWQAFVVALQQELPLARVRSELFNAGADWEEALASPGVAVYAAAVVRAWENLPAQLRQTERPEQAILNAAADARSDSNALETTPALAIAERAFTALLTRTAAGEISLTARASDAAADQFVAARGEPARLVNAYLSELLSQYTRHIVSREAGRLTETEKSVTETRRLTRELAVSASELCRDLPDSGADAPTVSERWRTLVQEAFARGRELPQEPQ